MHEFFETERIQRFCIADWGTDDWSEFDLQGNIKLVAS
jgi:hypothetical protein